jgi:hypothetical protein
LQCLQSRNENRKKNNIVRSPDEPTPVHLHCTGAINRALYTALYIFYLGFFSLQYIQAGANGLTYVDVNARNDCTLLYCLQICQVI